MEPAQAQPAVTVGSRDLDRHVDAAGAFRQRSLQDVDSVRREQEGDVVVFSQAVDLVHDLEEQRTAYRAERPVGCKEVHVGKRSGYTKKAANLLVRLDGQRDEVPRFRTDCNVGLTNNQAEPDVRVVKVSRSPAFVSQRRERSCLLCDPKRHLHHEEAGRRRPRRSTSDVRRSCLAAGGAPEHLRLIVARWAEFADSRRTYGNVRRVPVVHRAQTPSRLAIRALPRDERGRSRGSVTMAGVEWTVTAEVVEWRGPAPYFFLPMSDEDSADFKIEAAGLEYWGQGQRRRRDRKDLLHDRRVPQGRSIPGPAARQHPKSREPRSGHVDHRDRPAELRPQSSLGPGPSEPDLRSGGPGPGSQTLRRRPPGAPLRGSASGGADAETVRSALARPRTRRCGRRCSLERGADRWRSWLPPVPGIVAAPNHGGFHAVRVGRPFRHVNRDRSRISNASSPGRNRRRC